MKYDRSGTFDRNNLFQVVDSVGPTATLKGNFGVSTS